MFERFHDEEPIDAFDLPVIAQDEWVAGLYERHGLGETPSITEIEPVAKELLEDVRTSHSALEMVLGRRVSTEEMFEGEHLRPLLGIFMSPASTDEKFRVLLMAKIFE